MPLWRCPHCGTPQAEAARCWVCRRSTTSCATCRHFRRGVTAQLGYCGLDRRRLALRGDEMRACWTAPASPAFDPAGATGAGSPPSGATPPAAGGSRTGRTFVPVEEAAPESPPAAARDGAPLHAVPRSATPARSRVHDRPRWSLWGDAEPPT